MKRFFLSFAIAMATVLSASAETALVAQKPFDNMYIGIGGGVAAPLRLKKIFPLNPTASIFIGKQFTPVWGAEIEGTVWFGSNQYDPDTKSSYRFNQTANGYKTIVRGHYLGINGTLNLSNLFGGYKGTPRPFEVGLVAGLGWIHTYAPGQKMKYNHNIGIKTGVDLLFNLGEAKAHTIRIQPAVDWAKNGSSADGATKFPLRSKFAQLHITAAYIYHFGTSNGTHYFKMYDDSALRAEIARLNDELAKKPKEVVVEKVVEKVVKEPAVAAVAATTVVTFAQGSSALTAEAKADLDKVKGNVEIVATASPEGNSAYNKKLSQKRADAVAEYLKSKGVTVNTAVGQGVTGAASNRIAIISAK